MTTVAVLGERALIQGYVLAGAIPVIAETAAQAREVWALLPADVDVAVLTPAAAAALGPVTSERDAPMTVVMPS